MPTIRVLPEARILEVPAGSNLLKELRAAGFFLDAPCGGAGKCGKCVVVVNGAERLSCQI
ncbi:MAG: 2Fe-2S iron-sulfur cluster binding domain-containing protein, partial [Oscillospiraceae bacterium]|nr:2Fe-2S iron-sulfur cluster binding domain-containing protein [Oscillospiraceae bacterium]